MIVVGMSNGGNPTLIDGLQVTQYCRFDRALRSFTLSGLVVWDMDDKVKVWRDSPEAQEHALTAFRALLTTVGIGVRLQRRPRYTRRHPAHVLSGMDHVCDPPTDRETQGQGGRETCPKSWLV